MSQFPPATGLPIVNSRSLIPQLVEQRKRGEKIVVSLHGAGEIVVDDDKAFQRLVALIEWVETIESVRRGLDDVAHGRTIPVDEAFDRLREKYEIQDQHPA